ncbi:hypothetical protein [Gimesia aquarii]|uniref:Uncharacterized protein n=1 Tax=Gimesia aquarii TaxID=2527964 RepID=A0A517VNP6_9PLAN|nr:hypothetical protein [Gimesia aquarii]QDT94635.1 hypothetical protein V144x_00650 [Gimesia aquarii]
MDHMTKLVTKKFAIPAFLCFGSIFVAAMCHLYVSALDLHLPFGLIQWAFGLGIVSGLLILVVGTLLKQTPWGIIAGAFACYALTVGYIVFGRGIPITWLY